MLRRRVGLGLALALSAGLVAAAPPEAAPQVVVAPEHWGLPQLMRALADVRSASGRFSERKTLHVLNAPLVTTGTLTYVAPDRMQKVTLTPVPERFVLDGNEVTITGGPDQQTHRFSLTDDPEIAGLVEGIRATLAGDLRTLERFYVVQLGGDAADWQLLLQPKSAELAHFVKWIRIRGSRDRIEAVESENRDGDHTEMSIDEAVNDGR